MTLVLIIVCFVPWMASDLHLKDIFVGLDTICSYNCINGHKKHDCSEYKIKTKMVNWKIRKAPKYF